MSTFKDDIKRRLEDVEQSIHLLKYPPIPPHGGSAFSTRTPEPDPIQTRLDNVEQFLELLMRERGVQRVRVTEEIYQDLKTVISETREELRKVKPVPK